MKLSTKLPRFDWVSALVYALVLTVVVVGGQTLHGPQVQILYTTP